MREIKFRAWDNEFKRMKVTGMGINNGVLSGDNLVIMQFTGLRDKNGLTDIYEGDIIDQNGLLRGNVYEITKDEIHESREIHGSGVDIVVAGMGTRTWRDTEQALLERGCKYSE